MGEEETVKTQQPWGLEVVTIENEGVKLLLGP